MTDRIYDLGQYFSYEDYDYLTYYVENAKCPLRNHKENDSMSVLFGFGQFNVNITKIVASLELLLGREMFIRTTEILDEIEVVHLKLNPSMWKYAKNIVHIMHYGDSSQPVLHRDAKLSIIKFI